MQNMYNILKKRKNKNMKEKFNNTEIMNLIARLIIIAIIIIVISFPFVTNFHLDFVYYYKEEPIIKFLISDILKIKLEYQIKIEQLNRYTIRKNYFIIKKMLYITNKYDELIKEILKKIKITKLTIITCYQNDNPVTDSYFKFANLMGYNIIENTIRHYFKNIDDEYYQIINRKNDQKVNFEIKFSVRGYQIIKLLITNFSKLKMLKKEF